MVPPQDSPAAPEPTPKPAGPAPLTVRWDDTNLHSSYVNACNVMSTREEVVLLLGINQAWHSGQREIPVQLTNRIILSPHAAKRVAQLLENVLREHEARFGPLA
ncbi:MAG TPA: DUF3467 domain-containing protein [Candidatus Sulfotelmatobacter sp.]|nr:DUF3467 domain-containing protein [Candidatus Sulfotelmatobacter sp.]